MCFMPTHHHLLLSLYAASSPTFTATTPSLYAMRNTQGFYYMQHKIHVLQEANLQMLLLLIPFFLYVGSHSKLPLGVDPSIHV
jgi:hypothetical protein